MINNFINKIICGDCLVIMKGIPDNSVDMVITDPPYVLGAYYGDKSKDERNRHQWLAWCYEWLIECLRIAGGVIVLPGTPNLLDFLKIPIQPSWIGSCYISYQGDIPEPYSASLLDSRCFWEAVLFYGVVKTDVDSWFFTDIKKESSEHPCPKPLELMLCLVECCPEGGIVLDPFIGSGTTAVACKSMNRKYIGIDKDAKYCGIARARL